MLKLITILKPPPCFSFPCLLIYSLDGTALAKAQQLLLDPQERGYILDQVTAAKGVMLSFFYAYYFYNDLANWNKADTDRRNFVVLLCWKYRRVEGKEKKGTEEGQCIQDKIPCRRGKTILWKVMWTSSIQIFYDFLVVFFDGSALWELLRINLNWSS